MRARLYRPARNVMQAGTARSRHWVLEFAAAAEREIEPLMGWTASADTQSQVCLSFDTAEQALDYAKAHGIEVTVVPTRERGLNIRPRGYGENFTPDRPVPWTH